MEQNVPVVAKKVWNLVRVAYFMLRKGISKRKLLLDLNMMMKRGKIAGKALQNLMFHHHHHHHNRSSSSNDSDNHLSFTTPPPGEYEFSCSNTPANYPFSLFNFHKKHHHKNHYAATDANDGDMMAVNAAVMKALEMIQSETASPALPGFGKSPMVRQLRITDSPFPLSNVEEDSHVDEAAEEFISKFYNELRQQNRKQSSPSR